MYELIPGDTKARRKRYPVRFFVVSALLVIVALQVAFLYFPNIFSGAASVSISRPPLAPVTVEPTATPDCSDRIKEYKRTTFYPIFEEWEDAYKLAVNSPRLSLPSAIPPLQSINRQLRDITPNSCTIEIHLDFVMATELATDGLLAFMANKPDSEVQRYFSQSATLFRSLATELDDPTIAP